MKADPITEYVLTAHVLYEIRRRGLSEEAVHAILSAPEQHTEVRAGRHVLQSRVVQGKPEQTYLIRVFVDVDRNPAEVVTAYRTTKIFKYWRDEP